MKNLSHLATILIILCFPVKASYALCVGAAFSGLPSVSTFQSPSGQYDVFDTAEHLQTVNFQVTSIANALGCNYYVTLSAGLSGNMNQRELARGAGERLDYNVYTTAGKTNILKDNSAGASNHIVGSFPALASVLQTANHSLHWTIEPEQIFVTSATQFADNNLTIRLYAEVLLGIYAVADTKTISFRAKAESSVDLSLVNTGGSFSSSDTNQTVDFGTLTSGEQLAFDTIIRSNAANYSVSMQSQNSQSMVHTGSMGATIPYLINFNGSNINLSSGNSVQVTSSSAITGSGGARFPTSFTIGTLTGAETAGTYQDIITVTISAN